MDTSPLASRQVGHKRHRLDTEALVSSLTRHKRRHLIEPRSIVQLLLDKLIPVRHLQMYNLTEILTR